MAIKCPKCQTENPEGQRFCGECAAPLTEEKKVHPSFTKTFETPREELKRGTLLAQRYEIIEELGKGGMGKIYRADDTKIHEEVAIKIIKPEIASDRNTIERFSNELKTARKISHRNVCKMYDLQEDKGTHFITMEYIPGEDLKSFIQRSGQLAVGTTIRIASQICDGLDEANSLGIVHRDLKPGNIMIDKTGRAKIMDFGIARSIKGKGITGPNIMIGTPEYMSPEQVEGKEVDQRSDIYSLGIILYEMLTGKIPFEGDTPFAIGVKHKSEIPKDPSILNPQIPPELSRIILKCLAKDKESRFQSAGEVRSELEKIKLGITTDWRQTEQKPLTSREITIQFRLKRFLIPIFIVCVLIFIGLMIWSPWTQEQSPAIEFEKPSIAVLPFEDLSPQKDQEYMCIGLAESLINALTKIQDLRVPARTSSFSFQGKEIDIKDIGRKLDVKTLLTGSLQMAGTQIRIFTQLVKVDDGSVLWSEKYNQELDDIFNIQDEISLKIVEALKIRLVAGEKENLIKQDTNSVEAYQLYLKGRYFRWIENIGNFLKAKDYFEQAIGIDPNYASAYAGLTETYMLLGIFAMMSRNEAEIQAKKAVRRALELDDNSAEAHAALGVILEIFDWDWQGAEKEFKQAISLNPNCFEAHYEYGFHFIRLKRFDEAEAEIKKSLRIDPLSYRAYYILGLTYRYKGNEEKAQEQYKKSAELNPQSVSDENPVERFEKLIEVNGRLPQYLGPLARIYIRSGENEKAQEFIDELEQLYAESDIGNVALNLSGIYFYLDKMDEAWMWLERAYERRDPNLIGLYSNPAFDPVRQDPRYKALITKMGFE